LLEYRGERIVKKIKAPLRIIHGSLDKTVLLTSARLLFENAGGEKDLQIIEGGDHLLLGKEHSQLTGQLTVEWMKKTL